MFKLYCFLQSENDAQQDAFTASGAAARTLVQATCPTVTGYVQSRALTQQIGDRAPSYAASAELYFANAAALLDSWRQPEALAGLWNNRAVTLSATVAGLVRCVIRLPAHHHEPGIKAVFPFNRRSGMSVTDFQTHWWQRHGPIAADTESALYYPQCHPLPACYENGAQPDYDGVTELHWRDFASADAAMASEQMRVDQATDAKRFTDPDVGIYLAEEEVIIAP
ncbi:MAG: EthD domain-containing protein [Pseudomonadales bacterium]